MSESTQQHTLEELFGRAIQVENQAGTIYRELAGRFSHHPESAALWKRLAADEKVHAEVLKKTLRSAPPEKLASPAPAETWTAVTEILHRLTRDPLASITSLQDAYELAHELEHSEVNTIFEFLSVDVVPGKVEREFVRTHIAEHQKNLTDFREGYRGKDWRQVIPQ